jgi:hypothetical protein
VKALADGLARAVATGDQGAARIALEALRGLVDVDTPAPIERAEVIDLAARRKRGGR